MGENVFLMEIVQDITSIAWPEIAEFHRIEGCNSREIFAMLREWAKEFERTWNGYIALGVEDEHDYMLEVDDFASRKTFDYITKYEFHD